MAQRSSRAGPTAFLAADNSASSTAATRTLRLMPFSRSQNSKTVKKSAFITSSQAPLWGNKKVGRFDLPTLARWRNQPSIYTVLPILITNQDTSSFKSGQKQFAQGWQG